MEPKLYHFDLPESGRPETASIDEFWYPGIKAVAPSASSSRIYDPILGIRAVVIHATAGSSSSGAASVIFDKRASFHWLVPDEDEDQHGQFVWATCHEARAAWHVRNSATSPDIWDGHPKINHYSLGIEVVNAQRSSDEFSDWQIDATAGIVRYAWAKYPNLRHVVSHAKLDPRRRTDPGTLFPWDDFRARVLAAPEPDTLPVLARSVPAQFGAIAASCCIDEVGHAVGVA